jgi:hypothetical protein
LGLLGRVGALLSGVHLCGTLGGFLLSPLTGFKLRQAMGFGGALHFGALHHFSFFTLTLVLSFDRFLYALPCFLASLGARRGEISVFCAVEISPRI